MQSTTRRILYLEGTVTLVFGLLATIWPQTMIGWVTDGPANQAAIDVMRLYGAMRFMAGSVAWTAAMTQDPYTARRLLVPLLVGDVVFAWALWPWRWGALVQLGPTLGFAINRRQAIRQLRTEG